MFTQTVRELEKMALFPENFSGSSPKWNTNWERKIAWKYFTKFGSVRWR
jgi:hypothetical protein